MTRERSMKVVSSIYFTTVDYKNISDIGRLTSIPLGRPPPAWMRTTTSDVGKIPVTTSIR